MANMNGNLPTGLPQNNWLPAGRDVMPNLSTDSQDSFISQIPLPYHLDGYRDQDDTFEVPSNSAEINYTGASYLQASQMPFNPAPTNGANGYLNHHPQGTEYQNMDPPLSGPYPDYVQQPQNSQNYQTPQFYGNSFSGPPMPFQSNLFTPQMNNGQINPQYNQQHQANLLPYQYQQMQGQSEYRQSIIPSSSSTNIARGRANGFQVYDPRGMPQGMPYTSIGNSGGDPGARKDYAIAQSGPHRSQKSSFNASSGQGRNGAYDGRSSQYQTTEHYGRQQGNLHSQVPPPADLSSQDCRQQDFLYNSSAFMVNENKQQEYPVHPIGMAGNDQQQMDQFQEYAINKSAPYQSLTGKEEAPTAPYLPPSEVSGELEVKTPPRQTRGSIAKYSTPATAPPLGQKTLTPILRSRAGQSIQKIKIDPIRGPPPAFEPYKPPPGTQAHHESNNTAAASKDNRQHSHSVSTVVPGEDPFTSVPFSFSPENNGVTVPGTTPSCQALVHKNPFSGAVPLHGPIAPLVMPSMPEIGPSPHLAQITLNGSKPSLEVAFDPQNLPFVEMARFSTPRDAGVVRICNIPFNLTTAEVIAFLGRNARILKESDEPIHIIMERISGKTMDAFIEFVNIKEAVNAVDRYKNNKRNGRGGKLGNRFVDLQVSGQEQLMAALFPNAKNLLWHGAVPEVLPTGQEDAHNTGFKGFITNEELAMFVKHVENPQRCPFSKDCPQRPFEFLISTIVKYPWFKVEDITLEGREQLFAATRRVTLSLFQKLQNPSDISDDLNLNDRLVNRLLRAVFWCPGFTQSQKDDIAFMCGINTLTAGLAPYADHWHVFKALGPHPAAEADVLIYYIALIREATTSPDQFSLAELSQQAASIPSAFGNMCIEYPPKVQDMCLAEIANIEWLALDRLLRRALQD